MPARALGLTETLAGSFGSGNTLVNNTVGFPPNGTGEGRVPAANQAVNAGLTPLRLQERVPDLQALLHFRVEFHFSNHPFFKKIV